MLTRESCSGLLALIMFLAIRTRRRVSLVFNTAIVVESTVIHASVVFVYSNPLPRNVVVNGRDKSVYLVCSFSLFYYGFPCFFSGRDTRDIRFVFASCRNQSTSRLLTLNPFPFFFSFRFYALSITPPSFFSRTMPVLYSTLFRISLC